MGTASSPSTRRSIRPHRKSRAGCGFCKRRKVKCNEEKPCSNCVSFGLPCDLVPDGALVERCAAPTTRRGRGRPRKVWAPDCSRSCSTSAAASPDTAPTSPFPVDAPPSAHINLDNAELLLHFVTETAETFCGAENRELYRFWTRNAAQMGLGHPFVLHLIFAAAAFHLAYLVGQRDEQRSENADDDEDVSSTNAQLPRRNSAVYLSLARQHFTAGLSGFSAQLSHPGPNNCGALYLGAILTSYCTFAAGPTSRSDLLVCTVSDDTCDSALSSPPPASSWMPFVHGVRLMHEGFSPDVLFAGLMRPFKPGRPMTPLKQPVCLRDGFPRLDWEAALDGLRSYVAAGPAAAADLAAPSRECCLRALDNLIGIYAATYGRRGSSGGEITYDGPPENQFVFGWLYRLRPDFVACVRRREPCALLVLAHYAVLLNRDAVRDGWYIEGWRQHIVDSVAELLETDGECWERLRWPMEQVLPGGERRGRGRAG
ncbi:uncharacterized protein P884DRAFT_279633 [Thermothelomyces heterothallicus CBS 202.75]|uniref:uncharacterized protein n=1 Tax=Thermothelomyces heterothallicus CBS 202.75 TaxID=1149848 RepID=UPI0037449ADD